LRRNPSTKEGADESSNRHVWFRLKPLIFGAIITALLIRVGHQFEPTTLGRWSGFQAFRLLHLGLTRADEWDQLPVVIVDIGHLSGGRYNATSRQDLLALVLAIAKEKPAAIAIDLDFSPLDGKVLSEDKDFFFHECLKLTIGPKEHGSGASAVPIFLGVGRGYLDPPAKWFNEVRYIRLAAATVVQSNDTRRLPRWFTSQSYGGPTRLPSIGEALAERYITNQGSRMTLPHPKIQWPFEEIVANPFVKQQELVAGTTAHIKLGQQVFDTGLSPVNYGVIDLIQNSNHILWDLNAEDVPHLASTLKLAGKMVLIGDTEVEDTFALHSPVLPVRGVLLHACAAYTFAVAPLFEFRPQVRLGLDLLLSGFLLYLFYLVHPYEEDEPKRHHLWRSFIHTFILSLVLVLGWILVRSGVLWLDFIVIWFALAIHPYIEDAFDAGWGKAGTVYLRSKEALKKCRASSKEETNESSVKSVKKL
jgi:CHASE2 domain-containing sensor protein